MRLLVIDPNTHLSEIVQSVMLGEGHDVVLSSGGDEAVDVICARPVDLILGLMELGEEDGLEVLRRIRATPAGMQADVILMSTYRRRYDPVVQEAMAELRIRDFLQHPFSVLDLVDMLRRLSESSGRPPLAEAAPQPSPARTGTLRHGKYSVRNVSSLAGLWSSRSSGILHVENAPGGVQGWVTLQGGGPAHDNDWTLIRSLLQGGEIVFERASVDGEGDWEGMASLLFSAVYDESQVEFAENHRYDSLVCTEAVNTITALPLTAALKTLLRAADGAHSIGEQSATAGMELLSISAELHALRQLQLIVFQSPLARTLGSGASVKRTSEGALEELPPPPSWLLESSEESTSPPAAPDWISSDTDDEQPQAPAWMDSLSDDGSVPPPSWLSSDVSIPSHQPGWIDDSSDSDWTVDHSAERSWGEVSSSVDHVLSSAADDSAPPDLPDWMREETDEVAAQGADVRSPMDASSSAPEAKPRGRTARGRMAEELRERRAGHWRKQRTRRTLKKKKLRKPREGSKVTRSNVQKRRRRDPEFLRRIFKQELERLRSAAPAVVLGIPAGSSPALVTQSARRLRHRYKMVIDDRRMPEDVRRQAEELKGLVYNAYKVLKRGGDELSNISTASEQAMDEDWLLAEGQRLLREGNWARADAVLSRAHRIRIDHPIVLSHLGWARFHNPNREPDSRQDEAVDLLILSTQFDPLDVDTRYFLACVLEARDDLEAALRQVVHGLRIAPDHEAMNALLKELNARVRS